MPISHHKHFLILCSPIFLKILTIYDIAYVIVDYYINMLNTVLRGAFLASPRDVTKLQILVRGNILILFAIYALFEI